MLNYLICLQISFKTFGLTIESSVHKQRLPNLQATTLNRVIIICKHCERTQAARAVATERNLNVAQLDQWRLVIREESKRDFAAGRKISQPEAIRIINATSKKRQ